MSAGVEILLLVVPVWIWIIDWSYCRVIPKDEHTLAVNGTLISIMLACCHRSASGPLIKWQYSRDAPVLGSMTELAIGSGKTGGIGSAKTWLAFCCLR